MTIMLFRSYRVITATVRRSRNIDLVKRLLRREFRLADDVDDVIPSSTQSNKNDNNEDLTAYEKLKVTCSRCWSWIFDGMLFLLFLI